MSERSEHPPSPALGPQRPEPAIVVVAKILLLVLEAAAEGTGDYEALRNAHKPALEAVLRRGR